MVVDPADGALVSMWIYPELLPDALVSTDDGGYLLVGSRTFRAGHSTHGP